MEDAGSANGTQVGRVRLAQGEPIPLGIAEVFFIGSTMALIETRFCERLDEVFDDEPQGDPRLHRTSGRWTIVYVFDRTGERCVVASENQTWSPGLDTLTERERRVVAVAGKSNKEIAFDLGISNAATRVLTARAGARVGVQSRAQLLELPSVKALGGEPPGA